jgi:hypothetical protein
MIILVWVKVDGNSTNSTCQWQLAADDFLGLYGSLLDAVGQWACVDLGLEHGDRMLGLQVGR